MPNRIVKVAILALTTGAIIALIVASTGKADPIRKQAEPLFVHRFTEVASDRPGFRKYQGVTKNVVIAGTLLGMSRDDVKPPPGAYGEVAIGHNLFYYEKGFIGVGKHEGLSVLYVPADMSLPDELLK